MSSILIFGSLVFTHKKDILYIPRCTGMAGPSVELGNAAGARGGDIRRKCHEDVARDCVETYSHIRITLNLHVSSPLTLDIWAPENIPAPLSFDRIQQLLCPKRKYKRRF
jgi:hypothetical protein